MESEPRPSKYDGGWREARPNRNQSGAKNPPPDPRKGGGGKDPDLRWGSLVKTLRIFSPEEPARRSGCDPAHPRRGVGLLLLLLSGLSTEALPRVTLPTLPPSPRLSNRNSMSLHLSIDVVRGIKKEVWESEPATRDEPVGGVVLRSATLEGEEGGNDDVKRFP